jgi:hypothetical protein
MRQRTVVMGLRRIHMAGLILLTLPLAAGGCREAPDRTLPTAEDVVQYYSYQDGLEARVTGNVVEVIAFQPSAQLRRGGTLWAKVGPYILLFTEETHKLMEDHPGVAGVRVVTRLRDGTEVARALLSRTELTGVLWRRSLNIAGKARLEGTAHPSLLQDLVRWGEEHTVYEYNPRFASS